MKAEQKQYLQLQTAWVQGRFPQALLFLGPAHSGSGLMDCVSALAQLIFCSSQGKESCGQCVDCQMLLRSEHPDLIWVKPEQTAGAIKVDQIRALQSTAFLTPKRAQRQIILIQDAEHMNTAAANALLKILEEPPVHSLFILKAEQISTMPATVVSRCQLVRFTDNASYFMENVLALGQYYTADSDRVLLLQQAECILEELLALMQHQKHPCQLAARWSEYELTALLWFLYLVFAQVQQMHYLGLSEVNGLAAPQLLALSHWVDTLSAFRVMDNLNAALRTINQNRPINKTLVLESVLLDLYEQP